MTTPYTARPVMTAAELAEHKVRSYGRNYAESDDGYTDMEAEAKRGWHDIASWGYSGWDLGGWPYVAIMERDQGGKYELMQIVEGDRDVYRFDTEADRWAAIDYLFLWYSAGKRWAPLKESDREALNLGQLSVLPKFRGPMRFEGTVLK